MTRNSDKQSPRESTGVARGPVRTTGPIAVVHVAVISMEEAGQLEDHTVVIEDGTIRTLAPSAGIDTSGMQTVDGSGFYLMPGLADMHTHLTDADVPELYLANGITRVRNMDGRPWHLTLEHKIDRGEIPGPRVLSASPLIDGLSDDGLTARPNSIVLTDPADAEALVRQLARRGYREIKAYQWLRLEALRALGTAAAGIGLRMAGHCPDGITFEESIAAGMGCFEHLTGIATGHLQEGRELPVQQSSASRLNALEPLELLARHLDYDAIRRLAGQMAEQGIWNCPTLVVWQKQIQPLQQALQADELQYEHTATVRDWERLIKTKFDSLLCPVSEWLSLGRARDEALAKVVSILHEEGAPLLLGTDAPNPFVIHGCSIHQELENLVGAGLSPYEALRCGTVEAARFLDELPCSGTVAVGKRADLLLLREHPLENVHAVRDSLESVFVNGYYLTRATLDALLESRRTEACAAPAESLPAFAAATPGVDASAASFEEITGNVAVGCARSRRSRSADGGWFVEERLARSGPRGSEILASTFSLGPDWTIRHAEMTCETALGRVRTEIRWSDGAYRVRIAQPDGHIADSGLESEPLLPGERLAFSILPVWLWTQKEAVSALTLSIEHEIAGVAEIFASRPNSATNNHGPSGKRWRLSASHPGESTTQTYCISEGGTLISLEDTLYGAPRVLTSNATGHRQAVYVVPNSSTRGT